MGLTDSEPEGELVWLDSSDEVREVGLRVGEYVVSVPAVGPADMDDGGAERANVGDVVRLLAFVEVVADDGEYVGEPVGRNVGYSVEELMFTPDVGAPASFPFDSGTRVKCTWKFPHGDKNLTTYENNSHRTQKCNWNEDIRFHGNVGVA